MADSQTGGYILPTTAGLPGGLSLMRFIQTVFVGVSGLAGQLVRPKWQVAMPKMPDLAVEWLAIGIASITPDANAAVTVKQDGTNLTTRHELIEISCSFYGPNAMSYATLVRDGFQIQQNLDGLRAADMGFAECGPAQHVPDLINERFIDRVEMSVFFRRMVRRTYPITTFVSAEGTIHTVLGTEEYLMDFVTPEETP